MNEDDSRRLLAIVEALRDGQKRQLDCQLEALAVQREHFAVVPRQLERAEALQGRAEQLQNRSAQVIATARKTLMIVLPSVVVLIAYVTWMPFR